MTEFWNWCNAHPWVFEGIGVAAIGWIGLGIFRSRQSTANSSQKQKAKGGTAYQAGRDINIKK